MASQHPLVAEILADGVVSPAEYERAVFAHMACLEDAGLAHGEPFWNTTSDYVPRWSYEVVVPPLGPGTPDPSITCFDTYESDVQYQWVTQHEPDEREKQRREAVVVDCLREAGHEVASYNDAEAILESVDSLPDEEKFTVYQCFSWGQQGIEPVRRSPDPR